MQPKKKMFKEHRIPHNKFIHLKFSEYSMHLKHDDLEPAERKILVQMDKGDRTYWQLNHFRNIREFNNDGDAISDTLGSLAQKDYIKRVTVGPKRTRKDIKAERKEGQEGSTRKTASTSKWVIAK